MTRICLLIAVVIMMSTPLCARLKTLTISELVKSAEAIAVIKIDARENIVEGERKVAKTKNSLTVEKVLKGALAQDEKLAINTPGAIGNVPEDRPEFQNAGNRALVFLKKRENGKWGIVNGLQGVWPLAPGSDKTLGMGFNYSLEQIEKELATQK